MELSNFLSSFKRIPRWGLYIILVSVAGFAYLISTGAYFSFFLLSLLFFFITLFIILKKIMSAS